MVALLAYLAAAVDLRRVLLDALLRSPLGPERSQLLNDASMTWQALELGCWWSAALVLAFFTWLLYASLFDTIGELPHPID